MVMRVPKYDEAAQLRAEGLSFRQIARRLGVPVSTAFRWSQPSPVLPSGTSEPLAEAPDSSLRCPIDLSTPEKILGEIDSVYAGMDARGYSATAALKVRTLHIKLEAMRRIEPSPCASHITLETAYNRVQALVETVVQEFRGTLGRLEPEHRDAITEAVEALFERVRDCFNGQLKVFRQEDARTGGNLVA